MEQDSLFAHYQKKGPEGPSGINHRHYWSNDMTAFVILEESLVATTTRKPRFVIPAYEPESR